ncbi:hypothetical protein EVI78_03690 [Salmonella enterica subsp. enterica serovar Matopeni]|nr:hypothetical protein [Salmonella enterica]ECD1129044.1 hypothetical protein [Salmonella enterica subsp. enterica serovar Matopeni]ECU8210983.1 hypothetical protein [Salmonella enterica subsp. enterica serovar Matopeni]
MTALNKQAQQVRHWSRMASMTSERVSCVSVEQLDEIASALEAAEKRIAELEARQPYGYLRQCDGQIQISIGSERPHDRSGGYATPWFAIYTAAGIGVNGE